MPGPSESPSFDDALAQAMRRTQRAGTPKDDTRALWASLGHTPTWAVPRAPVAPSSSPRPRAWNHAQKLALGALVRLGAEGLTQASTDAELRRAYRQLAKRLHPDRAYAASDGPQEASASRFAALARAWSLLHHGPQP